MEINIKSNKFDDDMIQRQSYKIIQDSDNSIQRNSNSKKNQINYISNNNFGDNYENIYENDEDKNINLNININNYLSKKNININSNAPINNINYTLKNHILEEKMKRHNTNTNLTKGYLIRHLNKNRQNNNTYQNYNNNYKYNNIRELKEEFNSKFFPRMNKQKPEINNIDFQKIDITTKKGKLNSNNNVNDKQSKKVPKILTFLQTFKSMALPLKIDKNKKIEVKNRYDDKNTNKDMPNMVKDNDSLYNFNYRPLMKKINSNKYNVKNQRNGENPKENKDEDYIDYNRFTFRNSDNEKESPLRRRNKKDKKDRIKIEENESPWYNEESSDSDINKNINIDAYKRKYNNKNKEIRNNNSHKNKQINNINYKNKNDSEEFSPDFKKTNNIQMNLIQKKINKKAKPYLRKNIYKDQYSSPRPLHKNEIKNKQVYTYDNISEKYGRKIKDDYLNCSSESENSFRSLNPSKIYRKQILNNSFQINDNSNFMNSNSYYYNNDIYSDKINLEHNYYTINRPHKTKPMDKMLININDSNDSFNSEQNYNLRNNLRMNRSPINRKDNYNNNLLMNRSPFVSKDIYSNPYEYSDSFESQGEEKNTNKFNKNSNYHRFMKPFEEKGRKGWHNDDSYLSYDIENINRKPLYNKPYEKNSFSKQMNKNNSMYIKQIVHYDNKKNSFFNDSDDSFLNKKNTSYNEINNNVYDFDAPKSIHDFLDDKLSNNSSIYANDSSRENKFNTNSGFHSERNKNDAFNNKNNQVLSFREEEKPKMVYTKKLSTMYNFYQGTKKLFSNINNKVFKLIKKDDKNNEQNNFSANNGEVTPRGDIENEKDKLIFKKNFSGTKIGFINKTNVIRDNIIIKEKIKFKKKCFHKKLYNHFLQTPQIKNVGSYFSYQKIIKIKPIKKKINIPNSFLRFFKKGQIKACKIPLIKNCYIHKTYIIKVEKIEKEKFHNNNLLKCDNQVNIILSKDINKIEENDSNEKNNFSLFNKNTFDIENIKPHNIWNVSFINTNNSQNTNHKKYQYEYILSFKNNKSSLNNDLLPKDTLDHFKELSEPNEVINPNNMEKSEFKKYFSKEEIQKIMKRYVKPSKIQQINQNQITVKNNNNEINKEKENWKRSDFSKETEIAEKFIKELNKKMEENNKQNNIIGLLNILTMDNLNDVLNKIMTLITRNDDNFILSDEEIILNEYILVKAIINKAVMEIRFVNLYAKLSHELYHKLNNVSYNKENFKTIIIDECKNKFNELNKNEIIFKNRVVSLDDEEIILIKKSFIGNIDFICELINVEFLDEVIGFYYLEELNKIYNNDEIPEQNNKFKKNIALEATVNFLSKFGKKIISGKNVNNINKLNSFINSNLKSILDNKDLSGFLKYKIINLIEKQKNKWQDSLYEKSILAKSKNNKSRNSPKNKKVRKRRHSNKSLKNMNPNDTLNIKNFKKPNSKGNSLNSSTINYNSHINLKLNTSSSVSNMDDEIIKLIEKDIVKYKEFFNTNNITNRYDLIKNMQIGNEFDWSSIEEILSMSKIYLAEIIRCYVEVCIDEIIDSNQIYIVNDYIKNIICYYSTELTNKERDIIHNKVVNLFLNIRDICIDNENMKNIMGYLLLILIENKLYFIKNLNNFIGLEKEIIITIAEVVKFAIISSEEKSRKYHNDFKQTKLFADNPIFNEKVTNSIGDILK